MRVEVYGSLLNSNEREETLSGKGIMIELGKEERIRWKLSFDKFSKTRKEAVLNFVYTNNPSDVYYTTIYEVDDCACCRIMDREMGKITANKWRQHQEIDSNAYRPKQLDSRFGKTEIFIVPPKEEQKQVKTHWGAPYVKTVRNGIEESYKGNEKMKSINLEALRRAVEESKQDR